jgi:hypothetical protein
MNPVTALELADWRRATAALYARVREEADPGTCFYLPAVDPIALGQADSGEPG